MLDMLLAGFAAVFTLKGMIVIISGVALGMVFGAIPGLTATMAVALCLPITYGMGPYNGMALLMGLYIGGVSGGLIPAILMKIPGTPASIGTTFDGYPMAQKGESGKALGTAVVFSFLGGLISIIVLILIAPPLADIALKFGPYEYFAVAVFALTMVSSLSAGSTIKGVLSGLLGISLAMVGSAPIDSYPRFTFGFAEFDAGFSLLPALIGLFGISEILITAEKDLTGLKSELENQKMKGFGFSLAEFAGQTWNLIRSSAIGIGIGILPGIGAAASNLVSYITAQKQSKYPEKFGTGIMDGVVATEAANNASIGGALVPLIVLGIPGDAVTALLLGGLLIHGLTPGPLLFESSGEIVYGIFAALLIANLVMLVLAYFGMRLFIKVLNIPKYILLPIILSLCVVGAFGINNRMFDVWSLLFFGLLGYVMIKFEFPLPTLILGFILGPILETNLRRGLMFSQGDFMPFLTEPIAAGFLITTLISVLISVWKSKKGTKKQSNLEVGS